MEEGNLGTNEVEPELTCETNQDDYVSTSEAEPNLKCELNQDIIVNTKDVETELKCQINQEDKNVSNEEIVHVDLYNKDSKEFTES